MPNNRIQELETINVVGRRNHDDRTLRVQLRNPAVPSERFTLHVMPALSESGQASYRDLQPSHTPGGFSVYTGSSLRQFTLSDVKLLARTHDEALEKLRIQNLVRGWTKPYFGRGNDAKTSGLPPDVLILSAYGSGNIHNVPVILTSYTIDYPTDTDYTYLQRTAQSAVTENGVQYPPVVEASAIPIVSSMSLTLQEVRSMSELNNFDLKSYKEGRLVNWVS